MGRERPIGLTILAVIILINGVLVTVLGLFTFTFIFLIGLFSIFIGIGILDMKEWAWWGAILIYGLSAFFNFFLGDFISLAINIIILVYLILVSHKFTDGDRKSHPTEQLTSPYASKDDVLENMFGKDSVKKEYSGSKSGYVCPSCGSDNLMMMNDGSGLCNECKSAFNAPKKAE